MGTMAKLCACVAAMGGAFLFGLAILAGGMDSSAAEQGAATSVLGQLGQEDVRAGRPRADLDRGQGN